MHSLKVLQKIYTRSNVYKSTLFPSCKKIFGCLILSTFSQFAHPAQPTMSHVGMDAFLTKMDCKYKHEAKFEVKSNNQGVFDGDRIELQRLVAQLRAVTSIECPTIKRITLTGTVRGQLYFAGASEKSWGWRVIGLFATPK